MGLTVVLGLSHEVFGAECRVSQRKNRLMDEQIAAQSSILLRTSRETPANQTCGF